MRVLLTVFALTAALTTVAAADCKKNFTTLGLPLLSQIEYRTQETYKGLDQTGAAKRIASQLKAEGYSRVQRNGGVVSALQETSGSGRPQELRFIISERSGKTTIEAIFTIQEGQIASNRVVRNELCRLIANAAGS
jgi:hypothetical protein